MFKNFSKDSQRHHQTTNHREGQNVDGKHGSRPSTHPKGTREAEPYRHERKIKMSGGQPAEASMFRAFEPLSIKKSQLKAGGKGKQLSPTAKNQSREKKKGGGLE